MHVVRSKSIDGSLDFEAFSSRSLAQSIFEAGQNDVIVEGRERSAYAGATGGGEGARGEAQPAARSCPRTAVCQRQGSGRAPALPRTGRRDEGWREGPGLFG